MAAIALPALLSPEGSAHEPASKLLRYVAESPREIPVLLPVGTDLQRGDPVFAEHPDRYLIQVGRVESAESTAAGLEVLLAIYPESENLLTVDASCRALTVEKTAAWIVKILLPPERLAEIRQMGAEFFRKEGRGITELLWPQVRAGLQDMLELLEAELPAALAAQSEEWEAVLARHRDGVVKEKLGPALKEVTLVIAKEKFAPLLRVVGKELWEALPVGSLGTRALLDKLPFTRDDRLREGFEKYLREEAEPILLSHSEEATTIAAVVLKESMKDPRVKQAVASVVSEFFADPEVGALLKGLFDDLVIKNERLHAVMRERWNSGLSDAVVEAAGRLEPLITKISDSIVLTPDRSRINPRLTRVLRTRVMRKDCRWVMITGGDGPPLPEGRPLPVSQEDE